MALWDTIKRVDVPLCVVRLFLRCSKLLTLRCVVAHCCLSLVSLGTTSHSSSGGWHIYVLVHYCHCLVRSEKKQVIIQTKKMKTERTTDCGNILLLVEDRGQTVYQKVSGMHG